MLLQGEQLVGGWCKVFIQGYENPMFDEVGFSEYAGKRNDGSLNQQWATKPGTMIRKVAVVHALREAFPDEFSGLYDAAEMASIVQVQPKDYPQEFYEPVNEALDDCYYETDNEEMEEF